MRRNVFLFSKACMTVAMTGLFWFDLCRAFDATDINAQQYLRQQEQERALRERQEMQPDVRLGESTGALPQKPALETSRLPQDEIPCSLIQHITLTGELAEQFQWALAATHFSYDQADPAIGQCLGTRGIDIVTARVQRAIIDRGFITTRVLVAPQKLDRGTLTLSLIPGRIHNIRFAEAVSRRATQSNALPMKAGDILNLRDIEQALENFKRIPTASVDIKIAAAQDSQTPGASDLIISWQQIRPFRLSVFIDDSGSRSTGKYQGGVTLSLDHPLMLNDLFYLTLNHDLGGGTPGYRGTRGYTVHYSIPYAKWLLSLTQNHAYYYQSLPGPFSTHLYSGESDNSEIKLSRVLYRNRAFKTSAAMRLWLRQSRNFINGYENQDQQRRMAGWEASLSQRAFIQTAILDLTLAYRRGSGMLNTLPAPEQNYGEGTSRPQILTADTNLSVPFTFKKHALQYNLNARAQWNQTPLVPQDRFAIGSRYTVRGFNGEMQLIGERGYFVRNELGLSLHDSGQTLYVGLDYGEVDGALTNQLGKHLMGGVIGLRGGFKGFNYDLFVGWPFNYPKHFPASSTIAGFNTSYQY